jgi:hypothetical protein
MLEDIHGKITFLPGYSGNFGEREQLNIYVPADLDQFGRDNSHRTVIGRKGLVQLGHHTAYGTGSFHEVYEKSGAGQIQRSLHPGDAAADNQNRTCFFLGHCQLLACFHSEKGPVANLETS